MYSIGIYEAMADGGAVLKHILTHSGMDYDKAERKVGVINSQLGHTLDRHGTFTPGVGDLYAMFDNSEDLQQDMVDLVVM